MYARGEEVLSLEAANRVRTELNLEPLTLDTDFAGYTLQQVDDAIAASYELADADQWAPTTKADVVNVVIEQIRANLAQAEAAAAEAAAAAVIAPPEGYELHTDANYAAYISASRHVPEQAIKQLIAAANGLGEAAHLSDNATGWDLSWTAYVHAYSTNELYAYRADGPHTDGWPKVTVVAEGGVNSGVHKFKAW